MSDASPISSNGYGPCHLIDAIPETPEIDRTKYKSNQQKLDTPTSSKYVRANGRFKVSDDECESPLVNRRIKKRAVISDSDEDLPVVTKKKKKKARPLEPIQEYDSNGRAIDRVQEAFLSNKELSLRSLMEKFPKSDLMMLQDTLCLCKWNCDKAIHVLKDNCDATNCTHFLEKVEKPASPAPKIEQAPTPAPIQSLPPPYKKIQQTCNTGLLDGWLIKPKIQELSLKLNKSFKARRRIKALSSSDEEGVGSSDKNVTENITPNENKTGTVSKLSNSNLTRQKDHELSDNDANESNDVKDKPKKKFKTKFSKSKGKKKKKRRDIEGDSDEYDDDYGKDDVYDSDDSEIDETPTPARLSVLKFYNESLQNELLAVTGLTKKKLDSVFSLRPFDSWVDLVKKFQNDKQLSTDLLNGAREVIHMREVMTKLMANCEKYSKEMEKLFAEVKDDDDESSLIKEQPSILNKGLNLAPYQMVGLNWLYLMHMQELNGILADEMGLGKTIQAIAFLSHLLELGEPGPHLIVVPSSVLDNWLREISIWCDSLNVISYRGNQQERREMRLQLVNDELEYHILLTTYNMIGSSPEDRALFKRLQFNYVIFDEAHMLKNMATVRYKNLMGIKAHRRLCLTGTPLQNNLVELMSLLIFVMPAMFNGKIDQVRKMFTSTCKSEENRSSYERDRIEHAKHIMKPFVLRRLKSEVLTQLPAKLDKIRYCPLTTNQEDLYKQLASKLKPENGTNEVNGSKGICMVMELRKAANHPLLRRCIYTDLKLRKLASRLLKDPAYSESNEQYIFEDLQVMSDFEIHKLCSSLKSIKSHALQDNQILDSGKFEALDEILAEWKEKGERVLLFSQFVIMLNIIEEYMKIKEHKYIRLDGQTPVGERQDLIDNFTEDKDVFVFLLSTRAGGLGINLTAANVVILHDIDYNPYNDKQAEDRCHRVGQTRKVTVIRMISKGTIEEGMLHCAQEKLQLEKNITSNEDTDESKGMASNLLKSALGFSQ